MADKADSASTADIGIGYHAQWYTTHFPLQRCHYSLVDELEVEACAADDCLVIFECLIVQKVAYIPAYSLLIPSLYVPYKVSRKHNIHGEKSLRSKPIALAFASVLRLLPSSTVECCCI